MNIINKQRFLAELGKLLTFMYEEDRQTALAMYVKMFEDAEDELALIQELVSPTRQAVIVARAYNAKERKLQVEAQTREQAGEVSDPGTTPDFVLAIHQVYQNAVPSNRGAAAPLENQFSLFEEDMAEEEALPAEEEAAPLAESDASCAPETVIPAAEEETAAIPEEGEALPEDADEQPAPEAEEALPEDSAPEAPEDSADSFLTDFPAEDDEEWASGKEQEEEPLSPPLEEMPEGEVAPEEEDVFDEADEDEADEARIATGAAVRRAKPLVMILFLLVAIPLTLLGIAVLLIPTLLSLALALGIIAAGSATLVGAFSGFPVLADIMIVLGAALIILALGLLFLWLFIWLLGSGIGGLIRGVTALGAKWCYEEVAA